MKKGWYYEPGDYKMVCDECGFEYRRSEMRQRWDNAWVCREDWEPRHPQDYVKVKEDVIPVPIARPEPEPIFIEACTVAGRMGVVGVGTVGCAIVGFDTGER